MYLLAAFLLTPCTTMTIARDLVECWCIWVYTDSRRMLCMVMHLGHHRGIILIASVGLCYIRPCSTLLYHNLMPGFTVPDCVAHHTASFCIMYHSASFCIMQHTTCIIPYSISIMYASTVPLFGGIVYQFISHQDINHDKLKTVMNCCTIPHNTVLQLSTTILMLPLRLVLMLLCNFDMTISNTIRRLLQYYKTYYYQAPNSINTIAICCAHIYFCRYYFQLKM